MLSFPTDHSVDTDFAKALIGTWRRFGLVGPVYEVIAVGEPGEGGEQRMRVRIVETGEELDYRLLEILDDPRER
jgi:hypothetical protein